MSKAAEILRSRLRDAIEKKDVSPRSVSLAIGANHSYVSQILDGKGGMPSAARVMRLAEALDVSAEWLLGEASTPDPVRSQVELSDARVDWRGPPREEPGIPLMGTGDCADLVVETETGEMVAIERSSFDDEYPVLMFGRPPALRGARDVYGITFRGDSMVPRFEDGEVGIVDPRRAARIGDYVLVQLNAGDSDDVVSVLVKRLVRQNAKSLVLEQFNPPLTFTIPAGRVQRVHRILQPTDLLFG